MYTFSKHERWALAGLLIFLLPALLVNLGIVPLYVEEPRRATVALEMILRGNLLVPTINGEYYYLKPPFFNWILASVYTVTGAETEFITRIPTVASLLLFGLLIFFAGKKYVNSGFGALSALLFITASGNLFFNSLLAEIDLFYSLLTFTGLISLFHFHRKKKYTILFLTVYLLGAIGTLTKGLPSLVFTGLSLLVFFLVVREFRRLFQWQHFAGILLYLVIVGGYFIAYERTGGDAMTYLRHLTMESGKRLSGETFWVYIEHLWLYPLDTLMNLLPASVLVLFVFRKSFLRDIRMNPYMKFVLLMLIVHFPVYWLPPGGRQRYIIMLYPFFIQVFAYFFLMYFDKERWNTAIFRWFVTIASGLGALAALAPIFIPEMKDLPYLLPVCLACFVLLSGVFWIQVRKLLHPAITLMYTVVLIRIVFGFTVLPVRATEGNAPANRDAAAMISDVAGDQPVCILQPTYVPMQTIYYFEKANRHILPVCKEVQPGKYMIVQKFIPRKYTYRRDLNELLRNPVRPVSDPFSDDHIVGFQGYDYRVITEFKLQKREYYLMVAESIR